jgi:alpha-glucuronidase
MPSPISSKSVRPKGRRAPAVWVLACAIAAACLAINPIACARALPHGEAASPPPEDGYRLWLRYVPAEEPWRSRYRASAMAVVGAEPEGAATAGASDSSTTLRAAQAELLRGLSGLLGAAPRVVADVTEDGAILFGTPRSSALLKSLRLDLHALGAEGYLIRTTTIRGHRTTVIAANTDIGVLYGTFRFLQLLQTREPIGHLDLAASPRIRRRVLDHWDNLNGTVERGYAGDSIWKWETLPEHLSPRYTDYARACASIGINGVVLNNVNATPFILTPLYLGKVAALAGVLRPYGIRVYLSVPFSTPVTLGRLASADPLDPKVQAWWTAKVAEIYRDIPDFGGFLMKANSEGQPGPEDYHRTQAQGANLLAQALAPHHGIVMWRAFVYSTGNHSEDRARQAYDTFKPLDGRFADNVLVQVKNGPIDFQPREPFSPLFGQMRRTKVGLEVQLTREYLGGTDGIVFLAPMWSEVLASDTCFPRCGTPVKATINSMAGVANVGSDSDWTGSNFNQANWYAFGRLAWDPSLTPRQIADEWTRMTLSDDPRAVKPIVAMMLGSREAVVDYMTPLGLAHQFQNDHHYGPAPWSCSFAQANWNPCYYNKADSDGIGFDRTKSGSDAVDQYAPSVARSFGRLDLIPDEYLLWFHHVPWAQRLRSGQTLWIALIDRYDRGVSEVEANRREWQALRPFIDPQRFASVSADLDRQVLEARWWRDASIAYWQSLSKLPLPPGHLQPPRPLVWYEAVHFDTIPGFKVPRIDPRKLCAAGREPPFCR